MKHQLLSFETILGLINAGSLLLASGFSFYLAIRTSIGTLRVLSVLLGIFAFTHGMYHLLFTLVIGYPARAVFDTASVGALVIFALYYARRGGLA